MLSDIRKADIVTITGIKGKPAKVSQLEEMEHELNKRYQELLGSF